MNPPTPFSTSNEEHDAVFAMLPWHSNGSLSVFERNRVERHLERCAVCREEAAFQREVEGAVLNSHALDDAAERSLQLLQQRIAAEAGGAVPASQAVATGARFRPALAGWFRHLRTAVGWPRRNSPVWLGMPAAALGIWLIVLAMPTDDALQPPRKGPFATMTSQPPETAAELRVRFVDELSTAEIEAFVVAEGLEKIAGPSPRGLYDLRRRDPARVDLQALVEMLEQRAEVRIVQTLHEP